ncbi:hypothetical protein [Vibrio profundi]|uniref:hypothetical protein n=1 Tax=Vibrio profundi TaxID=1774960 RepID=UPI003734D771
MNEIERNTVYRYKSVGFFRTRYYEERGSASGMLFWLFVALAPLALLIALVHDVG